ncbi:E3 ubiquitin-protein ligase TRIM33, partial [Clarias magur]
MTDENSGSDGNDSNSNDSHVNVSKGSGGCASVSNGGEVLSGQKLLSIFALACV